MSSAFDNDIFSSLFNGCKDIDEWSNKTKEKAEKLQIEKEIDELVDKNPEFIYKCGVIDNMIAELNKKVSELVSAKTDIRIDIANRIIESKGEKYKKYRFARPSSALFGNSRPSLKKEGEEKHE